MWCPTSFSRFGCPSPGHKPVNSEPKSGAETRLAGGPKAQPPAALGQQCRRLQIDIDRQKCNRRRHLVNSVAGYSQQWHLVNSVAVPLSCTRPRDYIRSVCLFFCKHQLTRTHMSRPCVHDRALARISRSAGLAIYAILPPVFWGSLHPKQQHHWKC